MILVVQQGTEAGRELRLQRGLLTIGRAGDCDWVLHDGQASRYHAELRRYGDEWLIVDLGSTSGTYVGGVRLLPNVARPIPRGEAVTIGSTRFVLVQEPQDYSPGSAAPDPFPEEWTGEPQSLGVWSALTWSCRVIVAIGCGLLILGSRSDWLQVEVRLPLVGTVLNRTYGGMDTGQGWLFLGVAAVALVLLVIDVAFQRWGPQPSLRWGLAAGLGQALLGGLAAVAAALGFYRYYQVGTQKIWGISLLEILTEHARDLVHLSVKPGIYLVAAGLASLILGGLLRLIVAGLAPSKVPGRS
jgi:hypothetical protein